MVNFPRKRSRENSGRSSARSRRSFLVGVTVLALVAAVELTGATSAPAGASLSTGSTTDAPGTLIASQSVTANGVVASAVYLVSYWSEGVPNNQPVEVTGLVFVPEGIPPAGGWPVVSWAHYTDGTNGSCAPSLNPPFAVPFINSLLAEGWEVVATDYQGENNSQILSTSQGILPYLVGESAARNTIDIVRAAQQLPTADASSNYVVWGWSEGGQTAMFVQEIASSYAPSLDLEGVIAMAPPSNFQSLIPSRGIVELVPHVPARRWV